MADLGYRKDYKIAACPRCCPDGGAILGRELDLNEDRTGLVPVWECRNCGHKIPRREPKRRAEEVTPSQIKAQEWVLANFARSRYGDEYADRYFVKNAYVERLPRGDLSMSVTIGRKDSPHEHCLADCHIHVFIGGRHGTVTAYARDKNPNPRRKRAKKVSGWRVFFTSF
jgi:hypothetical protein